MFNSMITDISIYEMIMNNMKFIKIKMLQNPKEYDIITQLLIKKLNSLMECYSENSTYDNGLSVLVVQKEIIKSIS